MNYARENPSHAPGNHRLDERPWAMLPDHIKGFFLAARDEAVAIFVPVKIV